MTTIHFSSKMMPVHDGRRWPPPRLACAALLGGVSLLALTTGAQAQAAPPALNLCAGPSVSLPVLQPVANVVDTSVLAGTLNPLLSGLVGNINTNLTGALSGQQLSVSALDANGNLISLPSQNCAVTVPNPNGITIGGARIDGLGGSGNPPASAGDPSAIAIGNGSSTSAGATGAIALGTGTTATAAGATALGAGASASAPGSVALGSGSLALRTNGANELFSGTGLRTTLGTVSVGSAGNERQITNVAGGSAETDAVNVRQLRSVGTSLANSLGGGANFGAAGAFTAPSYLIGGTTYHDVGSALAAIQPGAPVTSLVAQAGPGAPITVGAATDGSSVSLTGTAGDRTLTGVAPGTVAAGSNQAVNGGQLFATNSGLSGTAAALGSGAGVNPNTGAFTAPAYAVAGGTYGNVGAALGALDGAAVKYDVAGGVPNYRSVTLGNGTGATTISNLAPGAVSPTSSQAVNGSQLFTTNQNLASTLSFLGGGASLNPQTGALTPPTFVVAGVNFRDVASALASIQVGPVVVNNSLVQQATPTSPITVGAATGGTSVDFTGTSGSRVLTGVAPGTVTATSTDAVNGSQLFARDQAITNITNTFGGGASYNPTTNSYTFPTYSVAGNTYNTVGGAITALDAGGVRYDRNADGSVNYGSATLGNGTGLTTISNVAPGLIAAGSTQAVNGGQLYVTNQRVDMIANTAVMYDVDPATGIKGNSVTLAGGDPSQPVLLRNVASGIADSDGANVGQVKAAQQASMNYTDARVSQTLQESKNYTDQQINNLSNYENQQFANLNQEIREARREARQGASVGLAAASLRFDDHPGKVSLAAGGATWRGEAGAAFGIGYTSPDGIARVNATASTSGGHWGVGGGLSISLN